MKSPRIPLVFALLASTALHAQDGPPRGHRPPPPPVIAALDTDKDGTISAAEIAAASTSLLTLDANGDGTLSKDELRPKPPEPKPDEDAKADDARKPHGPPPPEGKRRPVPPIIKALDTDGDGTLSASEIAAAPESLKSLDKNKDGALTPDEIHPPRPEGPRGPGPEDHGPDGDLPPAPPEE